MSNSRLGGKRELSSRDVERISPVFKAAVGQDLQLASIYDRFRQDVALRGRTERERRARAQSEGRREEHRRHLEEKWAANEAAEHALDWKGCYAGELEFRPW